MSEANSSISYPNHIAIIMDGNGRWAQSKGEAREFGHQAGVQSVKEVVKFSGDHGVKFLTLFAFGQDNKKRPVEEINFLMALFVEQLKVNIDDLIESNVRVKILGDKSDLKPEVLESIAVSEEKSAHCTGLLLTFALNYSGYWDIVEAAKHAHQDANDNTFDMHALSKQNFHQFLPSSFLPAVDLMIRTSGESRISDFMLWQLAYAELYFTPTPWPEFYAKQLQEACEWFATRERRFGKTSAQLT